MLYYSLESYETNQKTDPQQNQDIFNAGKMLIIKANTNELLSLHITLLVESKGGYKVCQPFFQIRYTQLALRVVNFIFAS